MKLSELGEDAFLRELERELGTGPEFVAVGVGDDAAALSLPDGELALLATDALVENVHFRWRHVAPRQVGRKAVAINASDIAAMGGRPLAVLLSIVTRAEGEVETLRELVAGVAERASSIGAALVGGNLAVSEGPLVVDVSVLGSTSGGRALRRAGGRAGESLFVSGPMGLASAGLSLIQKGVALAPGGGVLVPESLRGAPLSDAQAAILAHLDPEPRLELGLALNDRRLAGACIDVSDGLAIDLHRLCRASGVGARIEEGALPLVPALSSWGRAIGREALELALGGGEDYELLFSSADASGVEALGVERGWSLERIGELTSERGGVVLVRRDGSEEALPPTGWDHFRRG